MYGIIECRYCGTRVIVKRGGECPSCGKVIADPLPSAPAPSCASGSPRPSRYRRSVAGAGNEPGSENLGPEPER
jgi:hypothetical protein